MTIITTVEELNALPDGTVVLDASGMAWQSRLIDFIRVRWRDTNDKPAGITGNLLLRKHGPLTVLYPAAPRITDEMVERASEGVRARLRYPSLHWGAEDLHPDAIPHVARAALEAALGGQNDDKS